ncbi:bifunctional biotin--[acetyl-CoA-carboxylase] ligase/biotin operon repressor BirA [Pseudomonas sp. PS02288]|uniref:bifunctional biotin--[acetyl-CoA-carboxylase] ligase/biotin operon repressor BirA n=1 Tax=Pseudomonas sp. PS02288 TaxID=2991443 RepID=UPI00249B1413|nr:bifunctional biotin--[acetyl-CoA-carboxylase] ligase/biotin operon repressor BirA [Pseudomonas sp. PS02288]
MFSLLQLLKDGQFHSGQALGVRLGVSRSAIWKQLQALERQLGLDIHKVRGKGYRLADSLNLLDAEEIAPQGSVPWGVQIREVIDSTNAEALRLLQADKPAPFLVLAEQQTAGRGRRGRQWVSPLAQNLYMSLVVRIGGGARQLEGLSLVVGLSVLSALRAMGLREAGMKWPNDVLVGRKKVAGILLELVGDPADVCHVVIGIGINVNMREMAEGIDQPWTSVRLELGHAIDRNCLARSLSERLRDDLARHEKGGFAAFRAEWEEAHLWQGRVVELASGVQVVRGDVLGISETGALRLLVDGSERQCSGGELSLRLSDDS